MSGQLIQQGGSVAIGSVTGLGTNVATFLATPSGANLDAALTTALGLTKGGTGATSADAALTAFGLPSAYVAQLGQRVLRPLPLNTGGNFQTIAAVAYFCYLGQTMRATVIKKVRALLVTAATVNSVGEIGVFTTPAPPNGGNQTLTPTAAFTATLDDMTAAAPLARGNASDFSTSHAAGVHLWAGIRMNTGGNQPVLIGLLSDLLTGTVLVKTAAAAFDGSTTYAGVVPVIGTNATPFAPLLQATLD
jgi:hypothetical protein